MPNITGPALTYPTRSFPGTQAGAGTGIAGEQISSSLVGRYATLVKSGQIGRAHV